MLEPKPEKKLWRSFSVKISLSLLALAILGMHLFTSNDRVDTTAALLLAIAILPWIVDLLETLELPGGLKVKFRHIEKAQLEQGRQLEQLKMAFRLLVTKDELRHLKNFAGTDPMPLDRDWTTQHYEKELRRLLALRLITGSVGNFMREGGDARNHLQITDEGREFLKFREESENQAAT